MVTEHCGQPVIIAGRKAFDTNPVGLMVTSVFVTVVKGKGPVGIIAQITAEVDVWGGRQVRLFESTTEVPHPTPFKQSEDVAAQNRVRFVVVK